MLAVNVRKLSQQYRSPMIWMAPRSKVWQNDTSVRDERWMLASGGLSVTNALQRIHLVVDSFGGLSVSAVQICTIEHITDALQVHIDAIFAGSLLWSKLTNAA